jgi:hypothetical protein
MILKFFPQKWRQYWRFCLIIRYTLFCRISVKIAENITLAPLLLI